MTWTWLWVAGAAGAALLAVDRAALWAERRGWLYWRKKKSKFVGSGTNVSIAAELFQPNRAVYVQEMERKRIERQQAPSPEGPRPTDPA